MSKRDWQGLDAEAGALLEVLGCDTGRGEHEETAAVLRRAHEAGARAAREGDARLVAAVGRPMLAREMRALPLPSPERCPDCGGSGQVEVGTHRGGGPIAAPCERCLPREREAWERREEQSR